MKMNYLSKRDSMKLLSRIKSFNWGRDVEVGKVKKALRIEEDDFILYKIAGMILCEKNGVMFPTVHEEYNREVLERLPTLIVDMGAVPHIANGADVMRPGVREFRGEFERGEILVVRDERNLKPLAIAIALEHREKCESMVRGKIAENIHHVNDKIWKFIQEHKRIIEKS